MKKNFVLGVFFISTVTLANSQDFDLASSVPAVFMTTEQAAKLVESRLWNQAFKECEDSATPILLKPISYKIVRSSVKGTATFRCGI